ncbi:MAG: protein jag [Clostridia bacterium]|nr:protein jag [Clostridia bacterium]
MAENNVFTGRTVEEAIAEGLGVLGLTREEAEIAVLEEGKKKLFGAVKAKVQITKKVSDAKRASDFVDELLEILNISAVSEIVDEEENIKIDIKTTNSSRVIGKHGDVLDAIQTLAGAVANIGRNDYKKVVVDCENYRGQREETLRELAEKLAKKAVEKGRKMTLEPMNPYERRIIHSALANNADVKTISEGKEPVRYIAVIPNNANPNDRGLKYGRDDRRGGERRFNDRKPRGDRRGRDDRPRGGSRGGRPSGGGAKRGKKEIIFGTFLGNSGAKEEE